MNINKERIERIANKVRNALEIKELPYDPELAVTRLGGRISLEEKTDPSSRGARWDASIEKVEDAFIIHLPENNNKSRERFTIAHELGHLFLHMGFIINENKWNSLKAADGSSPGIFYRDNSSSREEYEAHEFAASFLMPKEKFIEIAKQHLKDDLYDASAISERFGVSPSAANIRGKWLGIFQW